MVAYRGHNSAAAFIANEIVISMQELGGEVKSIAEIRDKLELSETEFELALAWCLERDLISIEDEGSILVQ